MADAGRARAARKAKPPAAPAGTVPEPPAALHITPHVWPVGKLLHRVHLERYAAGAFNPGRDGNARFSPIVDASGKAIPTLYAGSSFECAAMETVFHDVPFVVGLKTVAKRKLAGQVHSVLNPRTDLLVADLRNVPLRKLGVQRNRLIDTEKDTYGQTRKWAAAVHAQHPDIQGLCWTSRQDDRAMAVMLFGDRVARGCLAWQAPSRSLPDDERAYAELLALADMIGVRLVAGRE